MKILLILVCCFCLGNSWSQSADSVVVSDDLLLDRPAQFPGGYSAMRKFLSSTFVYPQEALEAGIGGKCYLSFVVEEDGTLTNIRVVRGVVDCPECDQEALRFAKAMPKWIPALEKGVPTRVTMQMPLIFGLK